MYYSLVGKMRLSFIESDLLYRGTLYYRLDCVYYRTWFDCIYKKSLKIPKEGNQNPYIEEEQATHAQKKK
jgi:hypothetical protein